MCDQGAKTCEKEEDQEGDQDLAKFVRRAKYNCASGRSTGQSGKYTPWLLSLVLDIRPERSKPRA